MLESSPCRIGDEAGETSSPGAATPPPPLLTDLDEIELRADLRELRRQRVHVMETPPLPNQAAFARRSEWLIVNEREIHRLEAMLHG